MKRVRAVAVFVILALVVGVLGAGVNELLESPDVRDAYRAPWNDGANVLRVQRVGEHFALLTMSASRVVDSKRVDIRGKGGELLGSKNVYLMADEYGHAMLDGERAPQLWWDAALGITRTRMAVENLSPIAMPPPGDPTSNQRSPRP